MLSGKGPSGKIVSGRAIPMDEDDGGSLAAAAAIHAARQANFETANREHSHEGLPNV
jgi:hypothetical protein